MDFLKIERNIDNYDKCFKNIANELIKNYHLIVNKQKFAIAEVEFYLKTRKHSDPYIHGDELQKNIGMWYFHRQNNGNYKGGTFKGLDITFGDEHKHTRGGILIRSIVPVDKKNNLKMDEIIDGPCNVVNKIIELTSEHHDETVAGLVGALTKREQPSCTKKSLLYLVESSPRNVRIYRSPRIGLTLKSGDTSDKIDFVMKNYRFLIHPNILKKNKFATILYYNLHHNVDEEQLSTLFDIKVANLNKYIESFEEGKQLDGYEEFENKTLSVGDQCKLYGYCSTLE